ncbi:MAG: hypothetical protein ACW964_05240 [Candidatus Hodarchaeales archaeon]|jgi:hypothetical protein
MKDMSMNGNIMRYGAIAIVIGAVIAASVFTFAFIALNDDDSNGNNNQNGGKIVGGIGARIAARMAEFEQNITYIWCANNTWTNVNLSSYYGMLIDGFRVGLVNDTPQMALIHEPEAEFADISQQDLNNAFTGFRSAIEVLNVTSSIITDIDHIWPPTFMCDIAYEDGTALSIIFSKEHNVISVLNGTWELSSWTHFGIKDVIVNRSYHDDVYLTLTDSRFILSAIQNFENMVLEAFPTS